MLNIQCQCGGTALQWRERKELWRLECCCSDCSAGMRFLHETKGGPQPPNHQMLDTLWLPNDFSVTRGLPNIGVVKLSADSRNTLFYCKECGTSLITDHVVYQDKVVITQIQNYSQFQGMSSEPHMAVKARHFVGDVDPHSIDSLHEVFPALLLSTITYYLLSRAAPPALLRADTAIENDSV